MFKEQIVLTEKATNSLQQPKKSEILNLVNKQNSEKKLTHANWQNENCNL